MSLNLGLPEDRQDAVSPQSVELGGLLRSTIENYWHEHPEVTSRDIEDALRSVATEEVRDDAGAPVPIFFPAPDEGESRRVRVVTGVLVILVVIAMAAALFLIRRP